MFGSSGSLTVTRRTGDDFGWQALPRLRPEGSRNLCKTFRGDGFSLGIRRVGAVIGCVSAQPVQTMRGSWVTHSASTPAAWDGSMSVEQAGRAAHPPPPTSVESGPTTPVDVVELDVLFASYGACCYGLARSILRDADLAHDVVQEAFLDHWRGKTFDATRSTHRSWLLMLTHRKAVDRVRHEQRRTGLPLEVAPEQVTTRRGPEDLALADDQALRVRAALGTLSQVQREALTLAYWGGYTQREVADLTDTPLGTVKTRMLSGMVALRRALADERD
jgi:RNA polymerase sigma factor (sigma-70 family)